MMKQLSVRFRQVCAAAFAACGFCFAALPAQAQVVNTATAGEEGGERINHLTIGGYLDTYYGYFSKPPAGGSIPYFVSMNRHNELTVNLAYIDLRYRGDGIRARIMPGTGTYMNANYAAETGSLKQLVEAHAGVLVDKARGIWLDAGVLGSPYTNESAVSRDQLLYTRSFAPEYVPYYLSGLRLTIPAGERLTVYLFALNGWQQITDQNDGKALGTQVEFRPVPALLLNWNTFAGDERSAAAPGFRTRLFTDFYAIYAPGPAWTATAGLYAGRQARDGAGPLYWGQANAAVRARISGPLAVAARVEYYHDPDGVQIVPVTGQRGFEGGSATLGLAYTVSEQALFRTEYRQFAAADAVFRGREGPAAKNAGWWITSLAISF